MGRGDQSGDQTDSSAALTRAALRRDPAGALQKNPASEKPTVYELIPEGWSAPQIFWESSVECLEPETASSARNNAGIYSQLPELLYGLSKEERVAYLDLLEDKLLYWADQLAEAGSEELSADDRQRVAKMLASSLEELFAELRVSS